MPISYGGLLLFAAGLAGTLYGAPGVGLLLLLGGVPVFARMFAEHSGGKNGPHWFSASVLYLIAILLALSPMLFTTAFAALWVVCAGINGAIGPFNGPMNGASLPADVDGPQILVSVTMGICGLALLLRRCLLNTNSRAAESRMAEASLPPESPS